MVASWAVLHVLVSAFVARVSVLPAVVVAVVAVVVVAMVWKRGAR